MIGRAPERGAIATALAHARAGEGAAVLVTGEAGIGKTAILAAARAEATGMRVAEARMAEPEAGIAYAGLSAIAAAIPEAMAGISEDARGVLGGVLGLGPPRMADPLAVAGAVLTLLSSAASEEPLLVIVDDAQWLDPETAMALVLCARRIAHDPILILAAGRSPAIEASPLVAAFTPIPVGDLAPEHARALLEAVGHDLVPAVAEVILATAAGNPLALTEIPRALSAAQRNGSAPLPDPLPSGPHLESLYAERAAGLSEPTRQALLILAASAEEDPAAVVAAMPDPDALDEARQAGLLAREGLAFHHPLVRSGVYGAADPGARREAHRALADALGADPPARARHLAVAQLEADEQVASELEAAGMLAMARLGTSSAVGLLARSAELSVTSEARVGRLTMAAQLSNLSAAFPASLELLGRAMAERPSGAALARIEHLRGQVRMWLGGAEEAEVALVAAARTAAPVDRALAATILLDAVWVASSMRGDIARGRALAAEAAGLAGSGPSDLSLTAEFVRMSQEVLAGASPVMHPSEVRSLAGAVSPYSALSAWVGFVATQLAVGDHPLDAALFNRELAGAYRGAGLVLGALIIEISAAAALIRAGRPSEAQPVLVRGAALAEETGQRPHIAFILIWQAYAAAITGDGRATDLAQRAHEMAESVGVGSLSTYARHASAYASLVGGRYREAADALAGLAPFVWDDLGMRNPAIVPIGSDLIEAKVRVGDLAAARRLLPVIEADAVRADMAAPRAAALRCRGLVEQDDDVAFDAFREAIALGESIQQPLEVARTRLLYGERAISARRQAEARRVLRDALAAFEQVGAHPWASRSAGLLESLGDQRPQASPDPVAVLSPQEMQVALLVTEGLSNTEIGERLFITRRTVEFHLTNTYRKLGLRGRTALAAEMSRRAPEGAAS